VDPSSAAGFVGRSDELLAFREAIDAARRGAPSVLLVGGDAGIGKSSLVGEAAQRSGAELLVGRCLPRGGELIPLAPLAEMVRHVRRAGGSALSDPALGPLRDWSSPGPAVPQPSAGSLFAPLLELLAHVGADDAVVVAFEDLHWADPLTWDLFDFLSRNLADEHVVLVGTYRANEVAGDLTQQRLLGELLRLPAVRRLQLDGLSRDELATKVRDLIGRAPSPELVDEVLARGQGNPFFSAELVAAHLSGQAIPAVLVDLVAADLERLDGAARSVVDAIAVVGYDTSHDLLDRVVQLDTSVLEASLHRAIDAQFVVVDHETSRYHLRHALIGEVVYDELLPSERQRLHRRIAAVLADQPQVLLDRADRSSELAVHLDKAGDEQAAFAALLHAADVAETVAPAAALRHLERALQLWDAIGDGAAREDRATRLWQAAELAAPAVSNQHAADLAREAFRHGDPPRGAAWGHERLGRYLWASGHLEECAEQFAIAAALLSDQPGSDAAVVHAGLAQAELMLANYEAADAMARRAVELLGEPAADPTAWATAHRVMGVAVGHAGDPARAVELCRRAVETAPNAVTRMLAWLYLGVALVDAGAYQQAIDEMLDADAEAQRTGVHRSYGSYLRALAAEALLRLGRWGEADAILEQTERTDAFPLGELRLALTAITASSRRGDGERAHAALADAEARPVDPLHRWFLDRAASEAHLALGEWAAAASIAERALASSPAALWRARFLMYATVADVELALDARARRQTAELESFVERVRTRFDGARSGPSSAREAGDAPDGAAHLAHAAAAASRLQEPDPEAWLTATRAWQLLADPYWTAQARMGEAEAAAASGAVARAADALRDAHELATTVGSGRLSGEIEALSRRARLSLDAPVPVALAAGTIEQLGLTPREAEVLALVAAGRTNRQIGEELFMSEKTASVHVSSILRKLGVTSRVDAAAVAQRLGVD
jgi:DNA-binding CsgD family transcriptional regulator/tetratricopeptide (TPR) repeat protein